MRYLFCVIFITIPILTYGQSRNDTTGVNIVKTEYTQLDKISRSFSPLFGSSSGNIEFILVEILNLTTNENLLGVEIRIERTDTEILSQTIGFSNIGSLWGSNARITARNLSSEGYIFLLQEDLTITMDFLNEIIGVSTQDQDNYKAYSLSLYNRFELGMLYDRNWYFIVKIDDTAYRLSFDDGMAMLSKLNSFKNYVTENSN